MDFFKIFRRKKQKDPVRSLRIDGAKTEMTAAPDDAELAAQALLESRIYGDRTQRRKATGKRGKSNARISPSEREQPRRDSGKDRRKKTPAGRNDKKGDVEQARDVGFYRRLAEKIQEERTQEALQTRRFLTYAEQQLSSPLFTGGVGDIEQELYRMQDIAEREGGELLRRWQHCLAECIVRQMTATRTESTESTETEADTDSSDSPGRSET